MKRLAILAALAVFVALASQAHAAVTAADLYARCTANQTVCKNAFTWNVDNTSACLLVGQTDQAMQDKVVAWLKAHPKQSGRDDNDVVGYAISALWPCR